MKANIMRVWKTAVVVIMCLGVVKCFTMDQTCPKSGTCSPSFCRKVTNAACVSEKSTIDISGVLKALECNSQCTQSSAAVCSQVSTMFKKGGVKLAYCTDKFLVIHSDNEPGHVDSLENIPRPPGGGDGGTYDSQCVTRAREVQFLSFKVPLETTALSSALDTNNAGSLKSNNVEQLPGVSGIPARGPVAVALNGMPVFPIYNNQGKPSWESCELDHCNAHVGKGFDYHYHGDPFGPDCLYTSSDYADVNAHPPQWAFSLDGYKVFGRYLSDSAPGKTVVLDNCGGHTHDEWGYHYHSWVADATSPQGSYTAFNYGPYNCWKGDISKIDKFWDAGEAT